MTSKRSSAKPLLYTFFTGLKSGAVAPAAINLFVFLMISPVFTLYRLLSTQSYRDETGKEITQKGAELFRFLFFGEGDAFSILLLISAVAAGLFAAILSFKFITSKKTVNVYYSLGITRDKLYFGKYASGALLLVLSVLIPFAATFLINTAILGFSFKMLYVAIFYIMSYCATTLIAYSVTAAAFSAVGTFFEAGVFSFSLLLFPTVFLTALQTLMNLFLHGSPYAASFNYANSTMYNYSSEKLFMRFLNVNPLMFDYKSVSIWNALDKTTNTNPTLLFAGDDVSLGSFPSLTRAGCWLLISIAVMFVGMYLFQKRKAEICGFIGTNKVLNTYVTFTYGFAVACLALDILSGISSMGTVVMYCIGFALFALFYIVLELLLLRDVKAFVRGLYKLPAEFVTAGVIIVFFATGLFGFSSRIPDADQVQKVGVTAIGIESEYGIFTSDMGYQMVMGDDYSYDGTMGIVDGFTSKKDIETIEKLHEQLIALGVAQPTPFDDTAVKDGDRVVPATLQFVYTMKNGTVIRRSYNAATEEILKAFLTLDDTDYMRARLDKIFTESLSDEPLDEYNYLMNDKQIDEFAKEIFRGESSQIALFGQNAHFGEYLSLTAAEKQELINCLYSDLKERSAEEKYFPAENPLGILRFTMESNDKGYDGDIPEVSEPETTSESETQIDTAASGEPGTVSTTIGTTAASSAQTTQSETETVTQNGPLRISPLSADTYGTTAATTEPTEPAAETAESTSGTGDTTEQTIVSQTAPDKNTAGDLSLTGNPYNLVDNVIYNRRLSVILTGDMTNTLNFLKEKGLYDKLRDKTVYTSAKVVSTVQVYKDLNMDYGYWYSSASRYFIGSHLNISAQNDMNSKYDYSYDYSGRSVVERTTGYSTTDKKEIEKLLSAARFNWFNTSDSGYYVRFTDATNTTTTMFIPYSLIPAELKTKTESVYANDKK